MRRLMLVLLAGGGLGFLSPMQAQSRLDLSGTYRVDGKNQDGSAYTGSVEIAQSGSEQLSFRWSFPRRNGDVQVNIGLGLLQGDAVAVVYQAEQGDGAIGLATYRIERTPLLKLIGRWMIPGENIVSDEVLTKGEKVARR